MITKTLIVLAAAGVGVASTAVMPSDWIPLVTVVGGILVTLTTSIIGLIISLRTKANTEAIAKSVDGAASAAREREEAGLSEIKRLSKIVEDSARPGQGLTEREAGYILTKPAAPVSPAPEAAGKPAEKPI